MAHELRYVMHRLGEEVSDGEIEAMMSEVDVNGDRHVSFQQFTKMLANNNEDEE